MRSPQNLSDRSACTQAIAKAAAQLKDIVQRDGPSAYHARVPLLSVDEVLRRERPISDAGDLECGQVVVCERQPRWRISSRLNAFRNMDAGISYHFFLHFSDDTVEKICLGLQMLAWAGLSAGAGKSGFRSHVDIITKQDDRVLEDLRNLRRSGRLESHIDPR